MELEKITKEIEEIAIDFKYDSYGVTDPELRESVASRLHDEWMKLGNFADDEEKMRDFRELTKEQFLESYSYLTEEEYDNTMRIEMESCRDEIANVIDHLDRIDIRLGDNEWKLHYTIGNCIDQLEGAMYELMYGEE